MSEEQRQEERVITRPVKHPGRVAQGHKLVALMKKRKEEMKQQEATVEPTVSGTSSIHSNGVYYGVGTLAVLAIGVGVWFRFGRGTGSAGTPKQGMDTREHRAETKIGHLVKFLFVVEANRSGITNSKWWML